MMTKNPMQLKAFIKNKAAEKHISAQLVMQNYMLERLLERISLSPYKNNFILKGGFLISAIVGLDTRATMDLDTTIKGFTLTHEAIRKIFTEICAVQIADDVQFEVVGISDIRETDDYPGIRVALKANYPPISVPLTVDVTTGDMITPREVEYTFSLLFDNRTISILAYNLETVLAEKLETVLSRNIANIGHALTPFRKRNIACNFIAPCVPARRFLPGEQLHAGQIAHERKNLVPRFIRLFTMLLNRADNKLMYACRLPFGFAPGRQQADFRIAARPVAHAVKP